MFDEEIALSLGQQLNLKAQVDTHNFGGRETRALQNFNGALQTALAHAYACITRLESRISQLEEKLDFLKDIYL